MGVFWRRIALQAPKTNDELQKVAINVWENISMDEIKSVIDKLDEIYAYIIDTKGEYYHHNWKKY
jgi:hypothetical protein